MQNFDINYALKISVIMIMQLYVISIKHRSRLNLIILVIFITIIHKLVTNHSISSGTTMLFPFGNLNNQKFLDFISININESKNLTKNIYGINELQQSKIFNKEKFLSFFHNDSCSTNKNFKDFQNLL